jgi:hypothetical protein
MPESEKKARKLRPKLPATNPESLNETVWEHRVTDSGDYNGTEKIPRNSGDYEITTDYRRVPAESDTGKKKSATDESR